MRCLVKSFFFCFALSLNAHSSSPFAPRIKKVLPPQEPILNPPKISARRGRLLPGELVLAVKVGAEACAYPLNQLTGPSREIINDELGGRSVAVTW